MRGIVAAILAALLAAPAAAAAQTSSIPSNIQPTGHATPGPIGAAVNKEAKRLARERAPMSMPQAPARHRNWAARHPVILGTLAGAGVGLAFVAAEGCASSDYACPGLAAFFAGTGAGLGAAGGAVVGIFLR